MLHSPPKVAADSTTSAVTAVATVTIPDNVAGLRPKYILLTVRSEVGAFKPIQAADTPALAALARIAIEQPLILDVSGFDSLRLASYDGVQTANFTITPLENGGSQEAP